MTKKEAKKKPAEKPATQTSKKKKDAKPLAKGQYDATNIQILRDTDYSYPVSGIIVHDRYSFEILLKEPYPQILYWLALHFTSPIPHEAIEYYKAQKDYQKKSEIEKILEPFYLLSGCRLERSLSSVRSSSRL